MLSSRLVTPARCCSSFSASSFASPVSVSVLRLLFVTWSSCWPISSCFCESSRASLRIWRISSVNWLAFFFRNSSRNCCSSCCARVPEASACDGAFFSSASVACCASCRAFSICCRASAICAWFSGFSMRSRSSSMSASISCWSSRNRFNRRRMSSFSSSVFASCNAVCNSFTRSFKSCCRCASSFNRFCTCNCSRCSVACFCDSACFCVS